MMFQYPEVHTTTLFHYLRQATSPETCEWEDHLDAFYKSFMERF